MLSKFLLFKHKIWYIIQFMIILGINPSHLSTACLLIDGEIVACISEERFSRVKNQSGLPVNAVKKCLEYAKINTDDIDLLVLSFIDPMINTGFAVYTDQNNTSLSQNLTSKIWQAKEWTLANIPTSRSIYEKSIQTAHNILWNKKLEKNLYMSIQRDLNIPKSKVVRADHHTAHAFAAYYASPEYDKKPKLVLTLDAMGDGLCSTVSVSKNGKLKRIAQTAAGNSLGDLYAYITSFLGLKRGEHEYKVMGLAPYSNPDYADKVYQKLKKLIWVNDDLSFGTSVYSHVFYKVLDGYLLHERFDNVSGGIQKLTEELLKEWVGKAVKKTGIHDVVCGGGVFMNVKANQLIAELPEVKSIFIMPSSGDESTAMGAAFFGHVTNNKNRQPIKPLKQLYLGLSYSDDQIKQALKNSKFRKLKIAKPQDIELSVAKLLAENKIVARFSGRAEWGARALGNRSIIANPSNQSLVKEINEQIKSRDFWMPFAPSILSERLPKYTKNRKKIPVPYMIMTLDSTDEGKEKLISAMHPYDATLRPQEVYKDWNPSYYKLISEFERLTGIGGVLNTSFNLHGYPIVETPEDALDVLVKSGLKYLAIGSFLVSKP